ncbi:hypothetical protein NDU88_004888 [Pleurodeles waltl]|uniref:Uncharacterized protein n=1 Tax=Pleurodeles waltl TaxID=8319 RepID=A0AAV7V4S8_PLEWA|nr:hypothetical protein NDU88_004888 [Pleurodeles waltl]
MVLSKHPILGRRILLVDLLSSRRPSVRDAQLLGRHVLFIDLLLSRRPSVRDSQPFESPFLLFTQCDDARRCSCPRSDLVQKLFSRERSRAQKASV